MTFAAGAPQLDLSLGSPTLGTSSDDTITLGDGNNVVIGGAGADTIVVGATGANVIIGDDGEADYSNGVLIDVFSTDGTLGIGGNDTISGPYLTDPATAVTYGVAQNGDTTITLANGGDWTALGYSINGGVYIGAASAFTGSNYYTISAVSGATLTLSAAEALAGTDVTVDVAPVSINGQSGTLKPVPTFGGSGNNVVIGGIGADDILLGGANNTIIGDDGKATFDPSGPILTITTQDPFIGGNDHIWVTGGNNEIFGGTGSDTIAVTGNSAGNVILGDDGDATFTLEPVSNTANTSVLTFIETTNQQDGGEDTITTGDGNNVIFGGSWADTITVGNGNSLIFGDNGNATFTPALASGTVIGGNAAYSANLEQIETTAELNNGTETASQTAGGTLYGGDDRITAGNGNNVIVGGIGADKSAPATATTLSSAAAGRPSSIRRPGLPRRCSRSLPA